jgi:hypothetical protein
MAEQVIAYKDVHGNLHRDLADAERVDAAHRAEFAWRNLLTVSKARVQQEMSHPYLVYWEPEALLADKEAIMEVFKRAAGG